MVHVILGPFDTSRIGARCPLQLRVFLNHPAKHKAAGRRTVHVRHVADFPALACMAPWTVTFPNSDLSTDERNGLCLVLELYVKLLNDSRIACWSQHGAIIIPLAGKEGAMITELDTILAYQTMHGRSGVTVTVKWTDVPVFSNALYPKGYTPKECEDEYNLLTKLRNPYHPGLNDLNFGFYYMNGLVLPGWMYSQRYEMPIISLSAVKQCIYMGALRVFGYHTIDASPSRLGVAGPSSLGRTPSPLLLQTLQCAIQAYAVTVPYRSDVALDAGRRFRNVGSGDTLPQRDVDTYDECRVCRSGDCEDKADTSLDFFYAMQTMDVREEANPEWQALLSHIRDLTLQYVPFMALVDMTNGIGAGHMTMCVLPSAWFTHMHCQFSNSNLTGGENSVCQLTRVGKAPNVPPFLVDSVNPTASFVFPPAEEVMRLWSPLHRTFHTLFNASIVSEMDTIAHHSIYSRVKLARIFTNNFILRDVSRIHSLVPCLSKDTYGASLEDVISRPETISWLADGFRADQDEERVLSVLTYRHPPVHVTSSHSPVTLLKDRQRHSTSTTETQFCNLILQYAVYKRDSISALLDSIFKSTTELKCLQDIRFQLIDQNDDDEAHGEAPVECVIVHARW